MPRDKKRPAEEEPPKTVIRSRTRIPRVPQQSEGHLGNEPELQVEQEVEIELESDLEPEPGPSRVTRSRSRRGRGASQQPFTKFKVKSEARDDDDGPVDPDSIVPVLPAPEFEFQDVIWTGELKVPPLAQRNSPGFIWKYVDPTHFIDAPHSTMSAKRKQRPTVDTCVFTPGPPKRVRFKTIREYREHDDEFADEHTCIDIVSFTIILGDYTYELELSTLPFRSTRARLRFAKYPVGPHRDVANILDYIGIIIVRPYDVFKNKPGFSSLFIESFEVNTESRSCLIMDKDKINEPWAIPFLINSCKNLQVLLTPYSTYDLNNVSNLTVKYVAINCESDPGLTISTVFPSCFICHYSFSTYTYLSWFANEPHNHKTKDQFVKWVKSTCKTEITILIGGEEYSNDHYPLKRVFLYNDVGLNCELNQRKLFGPYVKYPFTEKCFLFDFSAKRTVAATLMSEVQIFHVDSRLGTNLRDGLAPFLTSLYCRSRDLQQISLNMQDYCLSVAARKIVTSLCTYNRLHLRSFAIIAKRTEHLEHIHDQAMKLTVGDTNYRYDFSQFAQLTDIFIGYNRFVPIPELILSKSCRSLTLSTIPGGVDNFENLEYFSYRFNGSEPRDQIKRLIIFIKYSKVIKTLIIIGSKHKFFAPSDWVELMEWFHDLGCLRKLIVRIPQDSVRLFAPDSEPAGLTFRLTLHPDLQYIEWNDHNFGCYLSFDTNIYETIWITSRSLMFIESNAHYFVDVTYSLIALDMSHMASTVKYFRIDNLACFNGAYHILKLCTSVEMVTFGQDDRPRYNMQVEAERAADHLMSFYNLKIIKGYVPVLVMSHFAGYEHFPRDLSFLICGEPAAIQIVHFLPFVRLAHNRVVKLNHFISPWSYDGMSINLEYLKSPAAHVHIINPRK